MLYHYTSIEVLKCLFENYSNDHPYLTFWASNCAFMNDPSEIKEGIKLIIKSIDNFECPILKEELKSFLENDKFYDYLVSVSTKAAFGVPYAISFSRCPDNLNMWNMYGDKSQGVMLGFNRDILEQYNNKNQISDCIYSNVLTSTFKEYINSLLQESFLCQKPRPDGVSRKFYNLYVLTKFASCIVPSIKHKTYEYEKETRMVAFSKSPKFRTLHNLLIPYIELSVPTSALENIMIGPNCDNRNILSVKTLICSKGLDDIFNNITQSTLPFKI